MSFVFTARHCQYLLFQYYLLTQIEVQQFVVLTLWRDVHFQTRAFEGRLVELNGQLARAQLWGQQQLGTLQSKEEELVLLKVEVASLRENYCSKVAQVKHTHTHTAFL